MTAGHGDLAHRLYQDSAPGNLPALSIARRSSSEAAYEREIVRSQGLLPFGLEVNIRSVQADWCRVDLREVPSLQGGVYTLANRFTVATSEVSAESQVCKLYTAQDRQAIEAVFGNVTAEYHRLFDSLASSINLAPGVEAWAAATGVSAELQIVAALCLERVPKACRVVVTMSHDPEDGSEGLNFYVFTRASVDAVVAAEDELHERLFQRVSSAKITSFSILYEFVG
jgi:hypothetical protein